MQTVVLILAIGIFAIVAYGDVRTRRIPNGLVYAIGVLGLVRMILGGDPIAVGYTLAASAVVLAVGVMLFWRRMLGGGDAKLLAASVLLVGHHELFDFLLVMSLCGLFLALAVLAADRLGPWLQHLPATVGFYGAPVRFAVRVQEQLDSWLHQVPRGAPGIEKTSGTASRRSVPYGVAIAAAGVLILVLQNAGTG